MRVLLDALQAGNRSGTGRYAHALAQHVPAAARAAGIDLRVLWPEGLAAPRGAEGNSEFELVPVDSPVRRVAASYAQTRRARADGWRADVTHFTASVVPPGAENYVVTAHDIAFMRNPKWFRWDRALYYRLTIARGIRGARHVIADSEATARDIEARLGVPRARVSVAPLGVSPEFYPRDASEQARVRARYSLPDAFLLFVGTIEPRKNLVRLIEAHAQVEEGPPLAIAGRRGWKFEATLSAAARKPERILFPDFIDEDDLSAVLSAAHAFVWPSLWEGFGLPPLEAMACGTPVLTSNTSSLPEVVGDAGVLVDPENVESIAEGLRRVTGDEELRARLRTAGVARAAKFSWEATGKQVVAGYERALGMDS